MATMSFSLAVCVLRVLVCLGQWPLTIMFLQLCNYVHCVFVMAGPLYWKDHVCYTVFGI